MIHIPLLLHKTHFSLLHIVGLFLYVSHIVSTNYTKIMKEKRDKHEKKTYTERKYLQFQNALPRENSVEKKLLLENQNIYQYTKIR